MFFRGGPNYKNGYWLEKKISLKFLKCDQLTKARESSNTFTEYAEKVHEKKISRLAKQVLWPQILCGWAARLAMALACWPGEFFNHTAAAAQHNMCKTLMKSQSDFQLFCQTVSNHYITICDCLSLRKPLCLWHSTLNLVVLILLF